MVIAVRCKSRPLIVTTLRLQELREQWLLFVRQASLRIFGDRYLKVTS
jgi:hypothetical protein